VISILVEAYPSGTHAFYRIPLWLYAPNLVRKYLSKIEVTCLFLNLGELDDTKLIEGITGEKSIYKKRGEHEPEPGAPQEKPKRLKLLVTTLYLLCNLRRNGPNKLECLFLEGFYSLI